MTKIPFKVSARAGKLLGRENFSNPEGAIIELVKNCYDADAKNCIVIFDIQKTAKSIYIIDNGDGMTKDTIENQWMKIGTGNKETNFISDDKRIKTGAKGIGRFALDRLGFNCEMWTVSKKAKKSEGYYWKMNWKQFDNSDKSISDITADLILKQILLKDLIPDFKIDSLKINISENISNKGTVIKISNLKDEWTETEIKDVFKSLEALIPPKELNIPFEVSFIHTQQPEEYGKVETAFFNDYDYKVDATYDAKKLKVDFEITRNELDIQLLKKKYAFLFENSKAPFNLKTLEERKFKFSKSINTILKWKLIPENNKLLKSVGSFSMSFYYLKFTNSKKEGYPYKTIIAKERKEVLGKFGGLKIYRDSFRVRPYGDSGNDWLKLGARRAQSPAGAGQRIGDWRVGPESTAGIIIISRKTNPLLIDKSDRGALVENDAFEVFSKIIIGIINEFEIDRSKILHPIYLRLQEEKERVKEIEIQIRAEKLAEKIISERKKKEGKTDKDKKVNLFELAKEEEEKKTYEEAFRDAFQAIDQERLEKDHEEIVQVRALASLGLIMSSFAHELKEIRNNTVVIKLLENIYKKIAGENLKSTQKYIDGVEYIELLKNDNEKISHWVDYSLTSIGKDKRKRGLLKFSDFFLTLSKSWKKIFDERKIIFSIDDEIKDKQYKFYAFQMDMNTIFTNLISNSIDSFNNLSEIKERKININVQLISDSIQIIYSDNGVGLSNVFAEKEEIFLPFTTSKKDKKGNDIGTGLGMYLVKNVVDDNNGIVEIMDSKIGFQFKIVFPVNKK